jgi:drug/metabolite transporter (DMT)-like permease
MERNWKTSRLLALTALVGVTAIWGSTFVIVQNAITRMPVMDFLAVRFSVATLAMIVFRPSSLRHITRRGLRQGFVLGVFLGSGYIAQTFGLLSASATVSGFITGMFVILTPIMAWIVLRHKVDNRTWLAVILATIGLGLLSLHGWSIGFGELLTLCCAIFFALHIVFLGEWSFSNDTYSLTLIQIAMVAFISLIAAAPGGISLPPDFGVWVVVGITAVLATALAFLIQTWAQSLVSPTSAAVVMTMEPVFAGIFGVVIGGNKVTIQILAGAVCVLIAMVMVQLKITTNPSRKKNLLKSGISD